MHDLNPKAVTNDELFGIINPATREWKDGWYHFVQAFQPHTAPNLISLLSQTRFNRSVKD